MKNGRVFWGLRKGLFVYFFALLLLPQCSEFSNSSNDTGGNATVKLVLPKGVSLKPGGTVAADTGGLKFAATITSIDISVTGADMATITQSVPLATLEADIEVPPGSSRIFTAVVKTDIGGTFSGSYTTDVGTTPLTISIDLTVASARVSGALSIAVQKPHGKAAVSTWAGATVEIFDMTGQLLGTGVADAAGAYAIDVPEGSNYFVRASIGNLVLKAFVPSTSGGATVDVNATSTAAVMVLAEALGVANLGESGVSASAAIAAADVTTLFSSILASPDLATAAAALQSEITANYDPNGTTASVGSASTAAASVITQISSSVTTPSPTPTPPSAPSGVAATAGHAQVTVSWNAVTGATSYNIYWGTATGVTTATGTKIAGVTSPYAHTGLTNGTTYYYIVTAENADGESAASSEASATPTAPNPPSAPTGVTATASDGQVSISWSAVAGATSYNIYWGTATGVTTATGTKIAGVTSPYADTGLTNGLTYYYIVTAVNADGEGAASPEVSATPLAPAGTPTGVSAAAGNAQTTVSWNADANSTSYNIYWGTATGVTTVTGTKIAGATSPYVHTGLTNGTTYYYVVTGVNALSESAASVEASASATAPPAEPMGLDQNPTVGDGQVSVAWGASAGATSYTVYYGSTFPVTTANAIEFFSGITATSYTVSPLTNGTTYYFAVSAVNAGGESTLLQLQSGTPTPPPAAPTGVTTISGNGQVTVSWNSVSGATFYYVYWGTTSPLTTSNATGMTWTNLTTSLTQTGRTNGTTYYYFVEAGNAAGFTYSSEVSGTPANIKGGSVQNGSTVGSGSATSSNVVVSTLAGTALATGTTDATGSAARFARPYGITTDGTNLYVVDQTNNTIRKIVIATGVVTTLAGSGAAASTDGTGTAASFNNPTGITTDGTNLYVTDRLGNTIRKVVIATGVVTTLAGSGTAALTDGNGTAAAFNQPNGIVIDGASLYVADQGNNVIRKILLTTNDVTTFATGFTAPRGITSDGTNLYVANSGWNTVDKIVIASGAVTTLAGSATGVAGSADGIGTAATFKLPLGITTDGTNLYVMDNNNFTVRKIVISTGTVTTIAGLALTSGSTDGLGSAARFLNPNGITTDGSNLYVADGSNMTVRKIIVQPGLVWTAQSAPIANTLMDVTWGNSKWVAVGVGDLSGSTIFTSSDGVTWTRQLSGVSATNGLNGIAWSGSLYVAVGTKGVFDATALIYTSPDGVTWTNRTATSATANNLNGVVWAGTQFVAVGNAGTIITSPDGITWTVQASGTANALYDVTWSGTQLVAVGALTTLLTSADGVTWTTQADPTGWGYDMFGVAWSGTAYATGGVAGTMLSSNDGITWNNRPNANGNDFRAVNWNGSQFAASATFGGMYTSPDGITWTSQTTGTASHLYGLAFDGTQYVAVGDAGTILTSR